MNNKLIKNLIGMIFLIASGIVNSSTVRVDFFGEVLSLGGTGTDNTVMVGDIISGHFGFDYIVTIADIIDRPIDGIDRTQSAYFSAASAFHLEANGVTLQSWVIDNSRQPQREYSGLEIHINEAESLFKDNFSFIFTHNILGMPITVLSLEAMNSDAFTSTSLPNPFPETGWLYTNDLFGSAIQAWNGSSEGSRFTATINSITVSTIPVPSAIWLFGSSFLGLVGVSRQKRLIKKQASSEEVFMSTLKKS